MTTKQILVKARALVKRGWTQGSCAKAKNGREVHPSRTTACCWCAFGALWKVAPNSYLLAEQVLNALPEVSAYTNIVDFNEVEGRTQEDVLAAFDKAIARCP